MRNSGAHSPAFDIVAIGASFGGVEAVGFILSLLPKDFPLPIVVAQHIAPELPSRLHEVLGYRTCLSVRQAVNGERLESGTAYTAPPNRHLIVNSQRELSVEFGPRVQFARPALDPLFCSVASVYGTRAIGIVLTGANGDGANGIRAIRQAGGMTLAQDAATSRAFRMPRSAIETRSVCFVLPLATIASAIIALTMVQGAERLFGVPADLCYPVFA